MYHSILKIPVSLARLPPRYDGRAISGMRYGHVEQQSSSDDNDETLAAVVKKVATNVSATTKKARQKRKKSVRN